MLIGIRRAFCFWLLWLATAASAAAENQRVVVNEIHYAPDIKTEQVEFIELHNPGAAAVDLEGWAFSDGVQFTFPAGAKIDPDGYLVVAQNPNALRAKFGVGALGPWTGKLANQGERIVLRDRAGAVVDEVEYRLGFPWPTVGEPPGYSIELVHPSLDNDLGGSWRGSVVGEATAQTLTLIPERSVWKYFKGTREPSSPSSVWRLPGFDDTSWSSGPAPIGYGENFLNTILADMRTNYSSVYFRRSFDVADAASLAGLKLETRIDDGLNVWINGAHVLTYNMPGREIAYNGAASSSIEDLNFKTFVLPSPAGYLVPGRNVIAIQAHNSSVANSSDFFLDVRLIAERTSGNRGPTPGRRNAVFAGNIPPQMRQVEHSPKQPRSGEPVLITAKVTDPDGVASVSLQYQVVEPGNYIELTDPAYKTDWTPLAMHDTGQGGDAVAADDIFTATLPGELQRHRRLIRYRITATDRTGRSVTAPYADDPEPNFACFVYDGVPGWRAAVRPGNTPLLEFSGEEMGRLPVYHLISKKTSVERATWLERYGGDLYKWKGTLVYDGKVYDHIGYRARGGVWRYAMGKNMWKFDFNRGHDFEARDNWGRRYNRTWTKLNLGACIQQGDFLHRGEQGMFESVGFRLFNLAGVEAPHSTFVTFRIIDDAPEASPNSQYEGDFWGLYLALEQEDGRFLDEHDLPDGNFYKMEAGTGPPGADGELNNQGATSVSDYSDLIAFRRTYLGNASDAWYRANLDLKRYYSYQAIVQGIHHYDICCGKNYFYYHNPETRLWQVHPWDLDLTWADNMYVAGVTGGTEPFQSRVLTRPAFNLEFRNRVREIRDLLFNEDQAWKLIDEYAGLLRGSGGGPTILDADRSQWDYNPIMANASFVNLSKAGHGRFYQRGTPTRDFAGMVQLMKNYVTYRSSRILDPAAADTAIPERPVITAAGPTNFPINRLVFRCSPFSGSGSFAALRWRVGEIRHPATPGFDPTEPWKYEIDAVWQSGDLTSFQPEITIPASALQVGRRYRVRAQMVDSTGRASHWSQPIEFTTGAPDTQALLEQHLRITEVMYHPPQGTEFEFVELHNTSATAALELSGVTFAQGIEFTFAPGTVLSPGEYLLVVKADAAGDFARFRSHYRLPNSTVIVGPYTGNLDNTGERITLKAAANGVDVVEFEYGDGRGWPVSADGAGHSLVPLESALANNGGGALNYPGNWRASAFIGGSPGRADPLLDRTVVLNEIVAHTDYSDPTKPEYDSNDWIELFNAGAIAVNLSNWFLSDDPAHLKKWAIPSVAVPPQGWLSFDEVSGFHAPITSGFGLDKAGEQLFLSFLPGTAEDRVVDAVRFKGQENDVSLGRFPDGRGLWRATLPSRNQANRLAPTSLVISEIMYHPPAATAGAPESTGEEFVEIFNASGETVRLADTNGLWRIDGGIQFSFPSDLVLAPNAYLLVVNFGPTNAAELSRFRARYSVPPSTAVVGPFQGRLANSTDRIAIEKPQYPDLPGEPFSWVVVDEVVYADQSPWPPAADGTGPSLQRISPGQAGHDPSNWIAEQPTAGAPARSSSSGDSDRDRLPDEWERAHGLNPNDPADASADPDGDGLTNLQEFEIGTDPRDASSTLSIAAVIQSSGSRVLRIPVVADHRYVVQYKDSLEISAWSILREISPQANSAVVEVVDDQATGQARFYRVVAH